MKVRFFLYSSICFLFFPSFVFSGSFASKIRIGILSKTSPETVRVVFKNARLLSGKKNFSEKNSQLVLRAESNRISILGGISSRSSEHIILSGGEYEIFLPGSETPRYYTGDLEIFSVLGKLKFILTLPREEYIASSVSSEFGELLQSQTRINSANSWKKEYKTSAAAVIRSYALANLGRHSKEGYDLCDLTHCLHYSGKGIKDEIDPGPKFIIKDAKNLPLETFFHSTCGGNLTSPYVFWKNFGENSKLFRSGSDIWKGKELQCRNSPHIVWEARIDKAEINEILNSKNVSDLTPLYEEGRVSQFTYSDFSVKKHLSISEFLSRTGKKLGWNRIKSNDFKMEVSTDGFYFRGRGLGHGIGLCQYGAKEMSIKGASSREILNFYFPGAVLETLQ